MLLSDSEKGAAATAETIGKPWQQLRGFRGYDLEAEEILKGSCC
jgi:hypothetical protein